MIDNLMIGNLMIGTYSLLSWPLFKVKSLYSFQIFPDWFLKPNGNY
jgi:hypothetical protein